MNPSFVVYIDESSDEGFVFNGDGLTNSPETNLNGRHAGPEAADSRDGVRNDIRLQKTGEPDILQTSDGKLTLTLTLSMPIQIKRRSGRKLVTLPNGETAPVRLWDLAPTSILALARGYRWLAMLDKSDRNGFGRRSRPRRGEPHG